MTSEEVPRDGIAKIKPDFLVNNLKRTLNAEFLSKEDREKYLEAGTSDGEPPKKKLKGQNKHRPREARIPRTEKFCPNLIDSESCLYGESCFYIHDAKEFLSAKPPDIKHECYLFRTYGKCPYGITCRFGSQHIADDGKNIINENVQKLWENFSAIKNNLKKDLQFKLRRHQYDFSASHRVIKSVQKRVAVKKENQENGNSLTCNEVDKEKLLKNEESGTVEESGTSKGYQHLPSAEECSDANIKTSGTVTDEDLIKLRRPEIKKVSFTKQTYLAPLTTIGNLPFRRVCKQFGADITCGEMAMALNLLHGQQSEWALLKRHHTEKVFGVQICGSHADIMTKCSQLLMENADVDFVDINVGCPLDFVCNRGSGCGLMNKPKKFEEIVNGMTHILTVPLTVKIRTGVHENKNTAHTLIPNLRSWGTSLVSIHGRSREQRYTKLANWDYIDLCAKAAHPMPIFGSGDVLSYEDYNHHLENTAVSGVMIARGAIIKPWIFTEIKEHRHWDISSQERYEILQDYVNYGLEHWGADSEGVEKTRRFLLEWLSFLYRYIPVGLLETLPQRINDRPPAYFGRNDLETLMSSPRCSDWIKISEMFLGPVPEHFSFLPKHKANSYS